MQKLAHTIIKYRKFIIIIVLIITAGLGYQIKNLRVDSDVISSLPDDDPYAKSLKQIGNQFGGNRIGMVILETDDVFKHDVLVHVMQITDSLKLINGISSVTSLTSIIDIREGEYGLEVGNLVDNYELPNTKEALLKLRKRVFAKDLYRGTIVSKDATATLVIFSLFDEANIQEVAHAVLDVTTSMNLPENIYYGGVPMLITSIGELISADMKKLIPITFLVIAVILFFSFRSAVGVLLPLVIAGIAIVWTIGIMAMLDFPMSMVSSNIPILLVAIGSAYAIHVISRVASHDQVEYALNQLFVPVILAAVTTSIGFISFVFGAYLEMIRDYGLFTALGTSISCLLSLTFAPAVMSFFKFSSQSKKEKLTSSHIMGRILSEIFWQITKHPKRILIVWTLLILYSISGIFLIKREVDIRDYFKEGNPTRKAEDLLTAKFGGTKPVFVRFEGDIHDPEVLSTMVRTEKYMRQSPDIVSTQSVAGIILELSEVLGQPREIPKDRSMIEQLWFLLDGNEYLERFVSEDLDEAIIISKFVSPDNQSKIIFAKYMNEFIEKNSTESCKIEITGMPFVDVTMDRSLINSQMSSLVIATLFVIIIVGLILRSFKLGIQATIPIISAIIILFGSMGFAEIPLNIGTVLVASVALGIGIDYSIHIISHFQLSIKNGKSVVDSLESALIVSGKPILINVLSVSAGFLVLLFSEMVPLQYFGALVAISMIGSGLGAVTLLPAIIMLSNKSKAV